MVGVDLVEELIKLGRADAQSRPLKGRPQLFLIEGPAIVSIDALKQLPQLFLRMFDKDQELVELYSPVAGGIDGLEDVVQQVVGILQRVVDLLEALLQAVQIDLAGGAGVELAP